MHRHQCRIPGRLPIIPYVKLFQKTISSIIQRVVNLIQFIHWNHWPLHWTPLSTNPVQRTTCCVAAICTQNVVLHCKQRVASPSSTSIYKGDFSPLHSSSFSYSSLYGWPWFQQTSLPLLAKSHSASEHIQVQKRRYHRMETGPKRIR